MLRAVKDVMLDVNHFSVENPAIHRTSRKKWSHFLYFQMKMNRSHFVYFPKKMKWTYSMYFPRKMMWSHSLYFPRKMKGRKYSLNWKYYHFDCLNKEMKTVPTDRSYASKLSLNKEVFNRNYLKALGNQRDSFKVLSISLDESCIC